jgi:RNA polymerase sigma-70 factor (ECF subfamily)
MPACEREAPTEARRGPDSESAAWLTALEGDGPEQAAAVERLHALLLRAAHFELARRRAALAQVRGEEIADLAMQAANDALVAILHKLDQYRGESRFTTWAYKFALLEASVRVRRRAWRDREVPLEPDAWALVADRALAPDAAVEGTELIEALRKAIAERLTTHHSPAQRARRPGDRRRSRRRPRRATRHDPRRALQDAARRPPQAPRRAGRRWVRDTTAGKRRAT